tara:strand:- start:1337 stop:1963 length:627 start_codon:yes stop_codon:yes gene_type:complete
MELSKELWSENIDLAYLNLNTGFVRGLQEGTLPVENFKLYIAQDSFFLEAFARAYGMAIAKSPDIKSISILSKMLNGVIEELKLHESYAEKWGVNIQKSSLNLATEAYTDFLNKTTEVGSMVEIISAMTPCMRLYAWIGKLLKEKNIVNTNPYKEWIDTYSDEDFEKLASTLEKLIDSYYTNNKIRRLRLLYNNAMKLELSFFKAYSP